MNFPFFTERQDRFLPRDPACSPVIVATSVQSHSQVQSPYLQMNILKDILAMQLPKHFASASKLK